MNDKNEHEGSQNKQPSGNIASKLLWLKPELISMTRSATEGGTIPSTFEGDGYFPVNPS